MRRCPDCQSPSPDAARFCPACGRPLPPARREPWIRRGDFWDGRALARCAGGQLPLLAFQVRFHDLLTAGPVRDEGRFLLYHLGHGLLLALGLAWARADRRRGAWLIWLLAGAAGGLLAEGLELWLMYRRFFSGLALWLWAQLGLEQRPELVYQLLQGLRLLGLALPLWLVYLTLEGRPARWLQAPLWLALGLGLRLGLRGAYLDAGMLAACYPPAWAALGLAAASALCVAWGLGPRGEQAAPAGPQNA